MVAQIEGVWLTGSTLNVQSLFGMLFMVGIAVSNSVLLVDLALLPMTIGLERGSEADEGPCPCGAERAVPTLG